MHPKALRKFLSSFVDQKLRNDLLLTNHFMLCCIKYDPAPNQRQKMSHPVGHPAIYRYTSRVLPAVVCLRRRDGNRIYMCAFPDEWESQRDDQLVRQRETACTDQATYLQMEELQGGNFLKSTAGQVYVPKHVHTAGTSQWMQYVMDFCRTNNY